MHKLARLQAPNCLSAFKHGRDNWSAVTPENKTKIWVDLHKMQGNRCAYCECELQNGKKHIEHFRQKETSKYPQGTFQWDNLFGSCNNPNSCGIHKDQSGSYNHLDLIKPDIEDPEKFFLFGFDGTINIREGLTANERQRAQETLRVFNLDAEHGPLRQMREKAAIGYRQTAQEILEMANEFDESDWLPLLQEELNAAKDLAFVTAIRHTLLPY